MKSISLLNTRRIATLCMTASILQLTAGCATNTVTGRNQLILIDEQQAIAAGEKSYLEVVQKHKGDGKLITEGPNFIRVTYITNRLIDEAVKLHPTASTWKWDVNLIENSQLNAWCMPGGKMVVYTGLLDKLKLTDDELAAIMGHEIAHALAGHGQEKMSIALASQVAVGAFALGVAVHSKDNHATLKRDATFVLGSTLATYAVMLPNSRDAENEADRVGVELSARAGYDPAAAAEVWRKMQGGKETKGSDFFSTHPSPPKRMDALQALEPTMKVLQDDALASGKHKSPPNAWISNGANRFAQFDREGHMKSVQPAALTTNLNRQPTRSVDHSAEETVQP